MVTLNEFVTQMSIVMLLMVDFGRNNELLVCFIDRKLWKLDTSTLAKWTGMTDTGKGIST
jgi:hypothetical protein